jgi:parvulin-like peptidyl-prolyl isomerase
VKQVEKKKNLKAKIIYEGKTIKKAPVISIIVAILIIAILAVGFLSQWTFYLQKSEQTDFVLVNVNGEEITQMQLNEQWDALPVIAKMQLTKDQLLEELVQETLLLQEARKEGIEVSDAEVNQFISIQLTQMGMTVEQFEEALTAQGTNSLDMKEIYKKQLTVAKLFDTTIDVALNATEEEVQEYYNTNKESFYRDAQVKVRHILVEINDMMNESQAQERVDLIMTKLEAENNENFCDLVQNYSSDFGSTSNCGEYIFGRGQMDPNFEEAGYNMTTDELRVVKTTYGFHIMLKVEDIPEGNIELNDTISGVEGSVTLSEGIKQVIIEEKAQEVFQSYVSKLTENAKIEYFDSIEEYLPEDEFETIEIDLDSEETAENTSIIEEEVEIPEENEEIVKLIEINETNPIES